MSGSPDAAPTPPVKALGANARPKIEVGAKVTVTGTVRAWSDDPLAFGSSGGAAFEFDRASVSVEVLTPPAPTWEAGDVVRDIVGSTFARQHESHVRPWRLLATHAGVDPRYREEGPTQPLTLLVRAGKAVTP